MSAYDNLISHECLRVHTSLSHNGKANIFLAVRIHVHDYEYILNGLAHGNVFSPAVELTGRPVSDP
eukprot:COSAG02_NODE_3314_length_6953_cov_4.605924_2_plen_66_part_00